MSHLRRILLLVLTALPMNTSVDAAPSAIKVLAVESCYEGSCIEWEVNLHRDGTWEGDACVRTDYYEHWDTICDWSFDRRTRTLSFEYWDEYAPHSNGFECVGTATGGGCFEGTWGQEVTSEFSSSYYTGTWSGCIL